MYRWRLFPFIYFPTGIYPNKTPDSILYITFNWPLLYTAPLNKGYVAMLIPLTNYYLILKAILVGK